MVPRVLVSDERYPLPRILLDRVESRLTGAPSPGRAFLRPLEKTVAGQKRIHGAHEPRPDVQVIEKGMAPVGVGVVQTELLIADEFDDPRSFLEVAQPHLPEFHRFCFVQAQFHFGADSTECRHHFQRKGIGLCCPVFAIPAPCRVETDGPASIRTVRGDRSDPGDKRICPASAAGHPAGG